MAKFPRRGASGNGRTYGVVGLCLVLVLFAVTSQSDWLKASSDQTVPHVEGRSLRSASTGSSFSLFSSASTEQPSNDAQGDDVLVMYLYDNRDPVWIENFKFFVQWGITPKDGCSYIILVSEAMYAAKVSSQQHGGDSSSMICMQKFFAQGKTPCLKLWLHELPEKCCVMQETLPGYETLPSNAEFAQANTQNCASGLGMLSQALNTTTAKSHTFKHYIFMNSYVRGPFLPNYLMVRGSYSSMMCHAEITILCLLQISCCCILPFVCLYTAVLYCCHNCGSMDGCSLGWLRPSQFL